MWKKVTLFCATAVTIAACNSGTATAPDDNTPPPLDEQRSGGTLGSGYQASDASGDARTTNSDSSNARYGGTLGSGY